MDPVPLMKRGPYNQGKAGGRPLPGRPWKDNGPPNMYPPRAVCQCGRTLPDEDGICVLCGHYQKGTPS